MAFTTYAGLQQEIINWSTKDGDDDFEAAVPGFIQLAESMFNNGSQSLPALRTREMEETTTISITNGVGPLPADFLEARFVKAASGKELEMTVPSSAEGYYEGRAGQPAQFAIKGGQIIVYPSNTETITLDYYQQIPALSDSNTSNWLLAKSPMAYLFGSLVFAATWSEDDQSIQRYGNMYQQAITGLAGSDFMSKYSRAASRARGYRP